MIVNLTLTEEQKSELVRMKAEVEREEEAGQNELRRAREYVEKLAAALNALAGRKYQLEVLLEAPVGATGEPGA